MRVQIHSCVHAAMVCASAGVGLGVTVGESASERGGKRHFAVVEGSFGMQVRAHSHRWRG